MPWLALAAVAFAWFASYRYGVRRVGHDPPESRTLGESRRRPTAIDDDAPRSPREAMAAAPDKQDRGGLVDPPEPGVTLVVRVIDGTPGALTEGQCVPSARVELGPWSALTDRKGEATLAGIPAGEHALRVRSQGFAPVEQAIDLTGKDEERVRPSRPGVVVRLQGVAARVSGFVIGSDGAPLAEALVCLDTRTRAGSGGFTRPRPGSDTATVLGSPPHAITDERGAFELDVLSGFAEQSLLVCSGRPGTPLIVRRPISSDELAGLELVEVRVPPAGAVELRCLRADGLPGRGTLELTDGIVTHDLVADAVLERVPGRERWNALARSAGGLDLHLAPGGYKALFRPTESGGNPQPMQSFYLTISGPGPQHKVLWLGDG